MTHPSEADLALLAGGDLPFWQRWRLGRHLAACPRCREEIRTFREASGWLREASGDLSTDLNWSRVASEMRANIRVGLAAGECVGGVQAPSPRLGWRAVAALASIALVALSGWWLHTPSPRLAPSVASGGIVLEATPAGIELKEDGRALTLLHPGSDAVMVSVSAQGSLRARYVDAETGMVTINNVYAQ